MVSKHEELSQTDSVDTVECQNPPLTVRNTSGWSISDLTAVLDS